MSRIRLLQAGGARKPLYIFPGIGGELSEFADLAQRLSRERSVYGVKLAGTEGECEPLREMQKLASLHAADLRMVQREGPYFLLGYSFGGALAFEVARELQSLGGRVGLVVLADSPAPGYPKFPSALVRAGAHVARLFRLGNRGRIAYLKARVERRLGLVRRLLGRNEREPVALVAAQGGEAPIDRRVLNALDEAYTYYVPTPLAIDVLVLSAETPPDLPAMKFDDALLGWGPMLRGRIIQCQTPGNHFDLFAPQNLEVLVQHVRAGLAQAERTYSSVEFAHA
jgi:thioesterase domain-containing protein